MTTRKLKIITFCNASYIPVAENWLRALEKINMSESARVVALDERTRDAFPLSQVIYRPLSLKGQDLGCLWEHRIKVLCELLASGTAIVHSDADAVWLRDPLHDFFACKTAIVFSQGTYWPRDVHTEHGLVLCCGLFYMAAEKSVLDFLHRVNIRLRTEKDDQVAVNREVAECIDGWDIDTPYKVPFRDTTFVASRTPIYSRQRSNADFKMKVAILPHHTYPRLVTSISSETVVAHPLSGKSLEAKKTCLGRLGLWFL